MLAPTLPPLADWANFYVIVGSSSAALTGLMFVVIALRSESRTEGGAEAVRAFGTPTVVHFCAVLLLAAILTAPKETILSLSLCLGAFGVAGLGYMGWIIGQARRQKEYTPVFSDWLWFIGLPFIAYACLLGAAFVLWVHPTAALYVVSTTALLLLYTGIHNAWDSATWIISERKQT